MELHDRTAMILGGSGLVGHAVARRLLAAGPRRIVLVALFEEEARAAARALEPYRATIEVEWGDVFLPASLARLEHHALMGDPRHRALLLHDLLDDLTENVLHRSFLYQLLVKYAGVLRSHALARLEALEARTHSRSVAYEMLGPPRLSKLLFEAFLCGRVRASVRALAESEPVALAAEAQALIERDAELRSHILSVGIPILTPDGGRLYWGSVVAVPADPGSPLAGAARGWVDLRPREFGKWIERAQEMLGQAERRRSRAADSGSDVDWTAIDADDAVEPAAFVTWVFRYEDHGDRIKR